MSETIKPRCEICDRNFKDEEGLKMHNAAKHPENIKKERKPLNKKKFRNRIILIVIIGLVAWGIYALSAGVKTLPPTSQTGHIEESPPSHVLREPMGDLVQRHMLEHADGSGPPGIIINYNCIDYACEPGLIENLEAFAEKYPENVYITPYPNMDAKIALTREGKIDVLEEYDESRINNFIIRR